MSDGSFLNPIQQLQKGGDWRPEELVVARHPLGEVALLGSCLADRHTADAALARAVEKDNPRVLTELPGSYAALLFQPDKLTILTDLANQFPIYYRSDSQGFHFASRIAPLRNNTTIDGPDALTLTAQIAAPWVADLAAGRSVVQGIHRLEAGHMLCVSRRGDMQLSPYETFQTPTRTNIDDAAEAFREALVDSVRRRAAWGRKVSSDFSGGFDSTSLAFLTAREMNEPLLVMTRHAFDAVTDDLEYARSYTQLPEAGGLFEPHELMYPAAQMVYADLLHLPSGDEPYRGISASALIIKCLRFLREQGSEVHLSGNGADGILDMDPRYYLGAFKRPRAYRHFLRSVVEVARTERKAPFQVLTDIKYITRMNPVTRLQTIAELLSSGHTVHSSQGYGLVDVIMPEWLTLSARDNLADLAASQAEIVPSARQVDIGNYTAYAELRALGPMLHGYGQLAAQYGLRVYEPYLDNDVLRACFSLPAHLRHDPWRFKALLGRALEGLVPDAVYQRTTKGNYGRHSFQGLRAAAPVFDQLLHNSRLADLGVIEPGQVQKTLRKAYMGISPPWASLDRLVAAEFEGKDWHRTSDSPPPAAEVRPILRESLPPLADIAQYGTPEGVIITADPNGAVVINMSSGNWLRLNMAARRVVEALAETGTFGAAVDKLSKLYPKTDRSHLLSGASSTIRQLVTQGILSEGLTSLPIASSSATGQVMPAMMVRRAEKTKLGVHDYVSAIGGIVMAVALKPLPFARRAAVLRKLHTRWPKPIEPQKAERILAAAHRLSASYLGRVVCWDLSLVTVLAGTLQRRRADLVFGVRTDPNSYHAWPEANGVPIRTVNDEEIVGMYQPVLKI